MYKNIIHNSDQFNKFLVKYEEELYPLFELEKYQSKDVVSNNERDNNQKIYLINIKTNKRPLKKKRFGQT